jgi:hypothetical protein
LASRRLGTRRHPWLERAGLHIGADGTLAPGTFWSGVIDDVRIYDRVVTPSGLPAGLANMVTDGEPYPARRVLQPVRLRPAGL